MIPVFGKKIARVMSLAFIVPSAMAVGYGLGYLLDWIFKTDYLRTVFLIIGVISGFYDLVREILKFNRELDGEGD